MDEEQGADVLLTGLLFHDLVLTGLGKPPAPGEEIWTRGWAAVPAEGGNARVGPLGPRQARAARKPVGQARVVDDQSLHVELHIAAEVARREPDARTAFGSHEVGVGLL